MGQGTVLGAGSVPDHRERDEAAHSAWCWKCASPQRERERRGRAQCLVLEVCLTSERDGAGHSAWCWKRDGARHSAWCWKCA